MVCKGRKYVAQQGMQREAQWMVPRPVSYLAWKPEQAAVKMLNDKKAEDRHHVQLCPGN